MGCSSSKPDNWARTGEFDGPNISEGAARPKTDYNYMCKILLLGDSGVGKSALMMRFSEGSFKGSFMSTVGIDFKMKTVTVDGKRVKIQIWDTAGQERFRTITKTYYRGAHGYILVFDVTNADSFNHVKHWLEEIKKNGNEDVCKMIVGNKTDLVDQRVVTFEDGERFAQQINIPYLETSAKDGLNVENLFMEMSQKYLNLIKARNSSGNLQA